MLRDTRLASILLREREREVQRDLLVRSARGRRADRTDHALLETVRLHLLGHGIADIARRLRHRPAGVAARLRTFDAVLVLHLYRLPPELAATVLRCRRRLIERFHAVIHSQLHDPDAVRRYLTGRGIELPGLDASQGPASRGPTGPTEDAGAPGVARVGNGSKETLYGSWC